MNTSNRIMVCPLDWGLGHASRCIPLIHHFIENGNEVIIGSSGRGAELLQQEFPKTEHFEFGGHTVKYGKKGLDLFTAFRQAPSYLKSLEREKQELEKFISFYSPDLLISDGRFGLSSTRVPSVLINHQLHPKFPRALKASFNRRLLKFYEAFDELWVPDFEAENNLSGELSHPPHREIKVRYIDPISRFQNLALNEGEKYTSLALISAPEPYRSNLEHSLMEALAHLPGRHAILCGTPEIKGTETFKNVELLPHRDSSSLAQLIMSSKKIICTAGYSTIMDLYALNKGAQLIPTPGQSEQEYLADYLHGRFGFHRYGKTVLENEQSSPQRLIASPEKKIDMALSELLCK